MLGFPFLSMPATGPHYSSKAITDGQLVAQTPNNHLSLETFSIYGVRWMLGNAFSGLEHYVSNEYYILFFNSETTLLGHLILQVPQLPVTCSSIARPSTIAAITYKCIVTQDLTSSNSATVPYQIIHEIVKINGLKEDATIQLDRNVIFSSTFKPIGLSGSFSMLFIGSWEINSEEWRQTVQSTLKDNQAVRLILTTGNFVPKLDRNNRQEVLRSIEGVTSRVALLSSNSQDPTVFFQQGDSASFYSPQWEDYQSFFSLVNLPRTNVTILSFDPPELSKQQSSSLKISFKQLFLAAITQMKSESIDSSNFVIGLSPFSFYCSQESTCSKNKQEMTFYEEHLSTIQLSLYLSGSACGYERTQGFCPNGSLDSGQAGFYDFDCTIYVNEGPPILATQIPSKQTFSAYRSIKTGVGLISIQSGPGKFPSRVSYHHIDTDSRVYEDSFTMSEPPAAAQPDTLQQTVLTIIIAAQYVFLFLVTLYIIYSIVAFHRNKKIESGTGHVEMVEEANPQPNQLRNPIMQ